MSYHDSGVRLMTVDEIKKAFGMDLARIRLLASRGVFRGPTRGVAHEMYDVGNLHYYRDRRGRLRVRGGCI